MMSTADERIAAMLCRWAAAKYGLDGVTEVYFEHGQHGPYSDVTPDIDPYVRVCVGTAERQALRAEQQARRPARGEPWARPYEFEVTYTGDLIKDIMRYALAEIVDWP